MVLFSVVFFRASMPYPSYLAVVPALGAALVIAGCLANAKILIARLLSVQPIVFIGLVSYAWYLWHWPLLTYTRIYNFGDRSLVTDGIAAVAALALAIATRYFVEGRIQTWRRGRGAFLSWKPVVVSLLFCSLFAFYGSYYASARNLGSSIPDKMMGTKAGSLGLCDFRDTDNLEKCLTESVSPRMGLILGDSQAASALVTLNEEARRQGRTLIGFGSGGCSALLKTAVVNPNVITSEVCRKSRQNLFAGLEHTKQLEFAILYSAWPIYGSDAQAYRLLGSHDDQDRLFVQGMRDTFDYLVSKGVQRILVIGPTPRFLRDAPNCVSRAILTHQDVDERCSQPVSDFDRDTGRSRSRIAEALEGRTNVRVLNPAATFCDERYCRSYGDQEIWFNDTNHISDYGMRRLIGRNQKLFDWVFGASQSAP